MNTDTFPLIGKYRFGWVTLLVLVILFIYGLVAGLTEAIWRLSPNLLIPFGILGTAAGWALAGARRRTGWLFAGGILSGLFLLIFVHSGMGQGLYQAFQATFQIKIHLRHPSEYLPHAGPFFYYLYTAVNNFYAYWTQISQWLVNVIFNQGGFNLLAVNLIWGSVFWGVLFSMGWLLRRRKHAFIASLPALTLLSAVTGSTRRDTLGLIIALSATLAIMVLVEHLKRESRWEHQKIDYSEELRFDIITITIPTVILIMVTAALVPRLSLEKIRSFFDLQPRIEMDSRVDLSLSLGLESAPLDSLARPVRPGMPRSHLIGSGPELSEIIVMEIETGEFFLPPQVDPLTQIPKYYSFGRSYDLYSGTGWLTGEIRQETIPAFQVIQSEESPLYRPVLQTIRKTNDAPPTLYFSGILNTVDRTITAAWHESTNEFFAAQLTALEYQVNTFIYDFAEEHLHQADDIPPQIILDTYLQLPPELPERIFELASNITAQGITPYEKARLIETFLRQYEYTLELPLPPEDRDLVDYFLFDLQKGYCDYFASAMVILARASGVPARLAVGYAPGTFDYTRQVFVVTEANAHAWPEIYLEPIGWVPFEPTASLSPYNWSPETEIQPPDVPALPIGERIPEPPPGWEVILPFGLLILLIALVVLVMFFIYHRRNKRVSTTTQIETIYQKMRGQLRRLFFALQTEPTPLEFCDAYTSYLQQKKSPGFTHKTRDYIIKQLSTITNLYEVGVYSSHTLTSIQIDQARHSLLNLQIRAWFLRAVFLFRNS